MSLLAHPSYLVFSLFRAVAKAAKAKVRQAGWTETYPQWAKRAEICERCPMRVVQCGVSYCGKPYLQQIARDPVVDGCGCPCRAKAKDSAEHCPLTSHHVAAQRDNKSCNCKWCKGLSPS